VSEEECVPQSQVQLATSRDAGHVLARFCLGAGTTIDDEETEAGAEDNDVSEYVKRYDFALDMAWGPSIFHLTKVRTNFAYIDNMIAPICTNSIPCALAP
jgi:hypothetical protein